jgi:hypothetical protein
MLAGSESSDLEKQKIGCAQLASGPEFFDALRGRSFLVGDERIFEIAEDSSRRSSALAVTSGLFLPEANQQAQSTAGRFDEIAIWNLHAERIVVVFRKYRSFHRIIWIELCGPTFEI